MAQTGSEAAEKVLIRQYNEAFGVRRMVMEPAANIAPSCVLKLSQNVSTWQFINQQFEQLSKNIEESLRTAFRKMPGETDGAKTTYLLSSICTTSLVEDKYGVVQVALPDIISTLIKFKQEACPAPMSTGMAKSWVRICVL